jgi:hypothetical protein
VLELSNELIAPLVTALASASAVYGGIRMDLRSIHAKIEAVTDNADEAHRRLDRHLDHSAPRR